MSYLLWLACMKPPASKVIRRWTAWSRHLSILIYYSRSNYFTVQANLCNAFGRPDVVSLLWNKLIPILLGHGDQTSSFKLELTAFHFFFFLQFNVTDMLQGYWTIQQSDTKSFMAYNLTNSTAPVSQPVIVVTSTFFWTIMPSNTSFGFR